MEQSYPNYELEDAFISTFMMPAIMPTNSSNITQMNMIGNIQTGMQDGNRPNMMGQNKFTSPSEGFLRGNMEVNTYMPYKGMTYIKPNITNERDAMLYKIQEMDFAAHDLNLYLDTHPNDSNTIKLYNDYKKEARRLTNEYEKKYGALNLSDDVGLSMTPWSWIKEPWPWNE